MIIVELGQLTDNVELVITAIYYKMVHVLEIILKLKSQIHSVRYGKIEFVLDVQKELILIKMENVEKFLKIVLLGIS